MDGGRALRRWMIGVGILYLALGVRLLPWINGAMIEAAGVGTVYTGDGLEPGTTAFAYLLDWMGTFGLDRLALGVVLLMAARDPVRNRVLAWAVIAVELGAGVLADAWFIGRDYIPDGFYLAFIVVHLVVIGTGVRALRRSVDAPATVEVTTVPAHDRGDRHPSDV